MFTAYIRPDKVYDVLHDIRTPKWKLSATGETRTNSALIDEILATIPVAEWKRGGPFLDPCCGRGTFLLKVIDKLEKYHSPENILNMIKGIDIDSYCVYTTKEVISARLGVKPEELDNIIVQDNFITWDSKGMKFNIVGNPPFQEGGRDDEANKLWPFFIKRASELVKDKGYVAMVSPTGWMQPTADIGKGNSKNAVSIFNDIFKANNLVTANINSDTLQKMYFAGVGSTFSYFTFQKAPYKGITNFITPTGTIQVDIRTIDSLPKVTSSLSLSITKKMSGTPFKFYDQNHGLNGKENSVKDSNYQYRVYHTNKKGGTYWYGSVKSAEANKPKVIISLSGKYLAVYNNTDGFSNMCMALVCDTDAQATQAEIVLNSKLYRFWVEMQKFSGFNPRKLILTLPAVDLNQQWDDQLLYKHFNLTTDEIAYIEGMFSVAE